MKILCKMAVNVSLALLPLLSIPPFLSFSVYVCERERVVEGVDYMTIKLLLMINNKLTWKFS